MTKIEEYQAAKRRAEAVTLNYQRAAGLDSPNNDKHRIECKLDHMSADGRAAILSFRASHGYFGDSGTRSDMDGTTAEYVARAITSMGASVMRKAAELAMADAEKARKAAEDEARAVLQALEEETP